jgi:hypothetical protein
VTRLSGASRQRWRLRRMTHRETGRRVSQLVRTATVKPAVVAVEAGLGTEGHANKLSALGPAATTLLVKPHSDEDLRQLRRGDSSEPSSYEILTPMGSPSPADEPEEPGAAPDGISAFVARVLNQLTLSAWLPAGFLTASVAVLLQFRSDRSASLLEAVHNLTKDPLRVLVLIIPLLVIATVVTQAFSFEAIRTLEGYWRMRGPVSMARTLMIRRQVRRKAAIVRRRLRASQEAFYSAEPRMLRDGIPFPVVNAMKAQALELENPSLSDQERRLLDQLDWLDWCDAWNVARIEHLYNEEGAYPPAPYRVLPTKLGNLIRATEDRLENTDGDLQGFAYRRYSTAPRLVQMAHDQYRTRLEMYCTLVFVSASLLVLAPLVLLGSGITGAAIAIITGSFAALGVAGYLAAIASAGGYCSALREMDRDIPTGLDGS